LKRHGSRSTDATSQLNAAVLGLSTGAVKILPLSLVPHALNPARWASPHSTPPSRRSKPGADFGFLALALSTLAACGTAQEPSKTPDDRSSAPAAEAAPLEPAPAEFAKTDAPPNESTKAGAAAGPGENVEHASVNYLQPVVSEGKSQSPINIVTSRAAAGKHEVEFRYQSSKEHVDNLGHTVKVTYDSGSSLEYDGRRFDLVQFHFHTPSEHLLDGVTFPMEMHLVHAEHDHPEHLLVVGVLFKEGGSSQLLDQLIANVPEHAGEHADKEAKLDASTVLKRGEGYFHYEGSLTTPPYSETVTWLVLDQAHDASAEQIEALNRIEGNNARHIQDQNARLIDHWR
jgi:carbonic anhydrase